MFANDCYKKKYDNLNKRKTLAFITTFTVSSSGLNIGGVFPSKRLASIVGIPFAATSSFIASVAGFITID